MHFATMVSKIKEGGMRFKNLFLLLVLIMACLTASICNTSTENPNEPDSNNPPNFIADACGGCPAQENIGNVTGIRFYCYVKNIGGAGKIIITIIAGTSGADNATQKFDVTAGTSYIFKVAVDVTRAASTDRCIIKIKFPGTAGYTDNRVITGYHHSGAPYDLQLVVK